MASVSESSLCLSKSSTFSGSIGTSLYRIQSEDGGNGSGLLTSKPDKIACFDYLVHLDFDLRKMRIIGFQPIIMPQDDQIPEAATVIFCITDNAVKSCLDSVAFFKTDINPL